MTALKLEVFRDVIEDINDELCKSRVELFKKIETVELDAAYKAGWAAALKAKDQIEMRSVEDFITSFEEMKSCLLRDKVWMVQQVGRLAAKLCAATFPEIIKHAFFENVAVFLRQYEGSNLGLKMKVSHGSEWNFVVGKVLIKRPDLISVFQEDKSLARDEIKMSLDEDEYILDIEGAHKDLLISVDNFFTLLGKAA